MPSKPICTERTPSMKYCNTPVQPCPVHSSKTQLRLNRLTLGWLHLKVFVSAVKEETNF